MDVTSYISGITTNITNQTQPNTIPPTVIGGGYVDLANLTATAVNTLSATTNSSITTLSATTNSTINTLSATTNSSINALSASTNTSITAINTSIAAIPAADANGNLYGAIVPDVQYTHVRANEISGNTTYVLAGSQYGLGMYVQMTKSIVVTQLTIPVWGALDSAVTVRLYKSSTSGYTPQTQTLLEEVNIPAGSFNSTPLTNAIINLTGSYKLATNDYVFIYLNVTAGTHLSYRYWSALAGAAPERHVWAYYSSTTGTWTTSWTSAVTGFYQSDFILSQKSAGQIALENTIKTVQATAVFADTNSNIPGTMIPLVQWSHSRGDAESVGNATYSLSSLWGVAMYEQVTNKAVVSTVSVPIWGASDSVVTVRLYKSTSFTSTIASLTLLEEKLYTAGTFNTASGMFDINFSKPYVVQANEYVYAYVYATAGTHLSTSYWNALYGSTPERHAFLLTTSPTSGFTANWTVSGGGFYAPALKFKYRSDVDIDYFNRITTLELNKAFNPRLAIPATVNVAIGRELNLWNEAVCVSYGTDVRVNYSAASATTFKSKERGLRYTPTAVESNQVTVSVKNRNNAVLATKTITVNAVSKTNGSGSTLQIVCIGDSTTLGVGGSVTAVYPTELRTLFNTDGGFTPLLLGTQGTAPNLHEGRGGWSWANYLSNGGAAPFNAFWDATNTRNDFQKWMLNNSNFGGTNTVDVAVIQLGINDVNNSVLVGASYVDTAVNNAKTFITSLLNPTYGYPSCKVVISLPPIASLSRDGWAIDFPNRDKDLYEYNMRSYYEKMIAAFDLGAFASNVSVCASGLWVDRVNGYSRSATQISARNTGTTLEVTSNYSVHPYDDGYKQQADAIYSHIRSLY